MDRYLWLQQKHRKDMAQETVLRNTHENFYAPVSLLSCSSLLRSHFLFSNYMIESSIVIVVGFFSLNFKSSETGVSSWFSHFSEEIFSLLFPPFLLLLLESEWWLPSLGSSFFFH